MKIIISLLIILALAGIANAEELVFDGDVYSGDSITIEDEAFIIYVSTAQNEIYADSGRTRLFVANNTCAQGGRVKICLDNMEYIEEERETLMSIRGISVVPEITIEREASGLTTVEKQPGDIIKIEVAIENNGGLASNITYVDELGEGMRIVGTDGLIVKNGNAFWQGSLKEGEEETFTYDVLIERPLDKITVAYLTYFDGVDIKRIYSPKITFTPMHSFEMEIEQGHEEFTIGQDTNFTVWITNNAKTHSNIELITEFDKGLKVINSPNGFVTEGNKRVLRTRLTKGNESYNRTYEYNFDLQSTTEGNNLARAWLIYEIDGLKRQLPMQSLEYTAKDNGIRVTSNLNDVDLESGQKEELKIWVQNLNAYAEIKNVNIQIDSQLTKLSNLTFDHFDPSEKKLIVNKIFFAPVISTTTGYSTDVNVSYTPKYANRASEQTSITTSVEQIPELTFTQTLSKTTLEEGEQATLEVLIKNTRNMRINRIDVFDQIPQELKIIGVTENKLNLDSDQESTAYRYIIQAPTLQEEKTYVITSNYFYKDDWVDESFITDNEYTQSKSVEITVNPEKFDLGITRSVEENEAYQGEVVNIITTINNPDGNKIAKNIKLLVEPQQYVDIIGTRAYNIADLKPGESYSILGNVHIRAHNSGSTLLDPIKLSYENENGFVFTKNGSLLEISATEENYVKGPRIFATKEVQDAANNTEEFEVTLKINNTGAKTTTSTIKDDTKTWTEEIKPGLQKIITYQKRIKEVGEHSLGKAIITYSDSDFDYTTASNNPSIKIQNQPLIRIVKDVPAQSSNVDDFTVRIKVSKLSDEEIKNILITDGEKTWNLESIEDEEILSYQTRIKEVGEHNLNDVKVTYQYKEDTYEVTDSPESITIIEKELLTLKKTASKTVVESKNEEITITLALTNNQEIPLEIELEDYEDDWSVELGPRESKNITYTIKIKENIDTGIATAKFEYNEEEQTIESENIEIYYEESEEVQEEKSDGIVKSFINLIIGILTWQRGG